MSSDVYKTYTSDDTTNSRRKRQALSQQAIEDVASLGLKPGELHLCLGEAARLSGAGQKRLQPRRGVFDLGRFVQRDAQHLGQRILQPGRFDQNTGVGIGNGASSIIAAFREHLIDADVAVTSLFLSMEENKTGRLLFPVSKYVGKLAAGTLYASKNIIDTNPDAVRAFVAGWIETVNYIRSHKAEAVKMQAAITGFPESVMAKDYDLTVGMFTKACGFDAESLETLKQSFLDLQLLPSAPDMATLYTEQFLPK